MSGASNCSGAETLPAASTKRTSSASPLAWAGDRVRLNRPSAPTTPVPMTVPPASRTCTVAPGSPRPVKVTPSAKARSVGCAGGTKSAEVTEPGWDTLPAASVRVTCKVLPSFTAGSRVTVKVPSAATVPVARMLPAASRTCTVVPTSPRPLSWLPARPITRLVGASGGVVSPPSMSGAVTELATEVLPAASVAVACSTSPSTCGGLRLRLNTPVGPTKAVPSSLPSAATMRTVLPGSARPVTTLPSALTASSVGAAGAVMSGAVICAGSEETPPSSMATTSSSSPLAWGGSRVTVKLPSGPATTVPISVPLASCTSTRVPAGAIPLMLLPSSANTRSLGLAGAVVTGTSNCSAEEALPLGSVCTRVNCSPGCAAGARSIRKVPLAPTTLVPITVPLASRTSTVAPGSPRPLRAVPPGPTRMSVTASGGVISGAVNSSGIELLPAASTRRTSSASPFVWAGDRVRLNRPSAPTTPVPIRLPAASRTCTVAPGSPRPVKVTPSAKARSVGCAGGSKSAEVTEPGWDTLPAASVRVTCKVLPSFTAGSRVTVKVPSAATVPVARMLPAASRTCTVVHSAS
ncbi:hypothetical protein T1E_5162 [Pseudomonas putida DOT-T1E]|uniref:Uncharacterized protein n=1 Tax=Pseudomonas putida (strain DOT-T1E) TaxID=1196325 RepID=I7B765_PSEPT|nr:hypothetical protein T1E_5162 [Pseudomonas putida DOT-T1E]